MRELKFLEDEDEISQCIFNILLQSPHSKPLCPRLVKLSWIAGPTLGGDFTPFISPQLQHVHLASRPGTVFSFSHAISALPASSLKTLRLSVIGDEPVGEAITCMFRACRENLTKLKISRMNQLRDITWCRVISLPRLHTLETDQSPPVMSHTNLPPSFPSLQRLTLRGPVAFTWVNFLAAENARRVSSGTESQSRAVAPRLVQLYCDYETDLHVAFLSRFWVFRNLCTLILGTACSPARCTFHLTDGDISQLAAELPGLRYLFLGAPCSHNTCFTTIISLLTLSAHCGHLSKLCIHFNTRNFARSMKHSLRHPLRRNPHPPSRCPLAVLDVGQIPLTPEELGNDLFSALIGLVDIFPGLQKISYTPSSHFREYRGWWQLNAQIPGFQEMRKSLPVVFTQ